MSLERKSWEWDGMIMVYLYNSHVWASQILGKIIYNEMGRRGKLAVVER